MFTSYILTAFKQKNEFVERVWPAKATLALFRLIAFKQLNSLTTIDTDDLCTKCNASECVAKDPGFDCQLF